MRRKCTIIGVYHIPVGENMRVFNSITEYAAQSSCVALGFFDGVHLGHRAVISACCAGREGDTAAVLTFRESPAAVLGCGAPPMLTDNSRKAQLISEIGADAVIFTDFAAIRDLSPDAFVRLILRDRLRARRVFCGHNYRFGKGGAGDVGALIRLCADEGIEAAEVAPVTSGGEPVSSTRIRALITDGEIKDANRMLGYAYAIGGGVASGNRIGTTLGFPTVNLPIGEGLCVPRFGVYASRVTVDGKVYRGATNIGVHPTVGENDRPLCETFLIDYPGGDLYGSSASCELLDFIRPERRFDTPAELRVQVERDICLIRGRDGILI